MKKEKSYRIKTKSNGDIYNFKPITGYDVNLYETEFSNIPIFESEDYSQRLDDTLDEQINNHKEEK